MAKKTRQTFQKREKERARQQKQKDKEQRRMESKNRRATGSALEGEDPDIAGIHPGPQPLPEQWEVGEPVE
ncbi:MAG TPA: hypothetical protein VID27_16680 [Blastocatellia bacterium]|jgi:hypothetical protein